MARGSSLKVLGSEAETQRFAKRMDSLVAYYLKYGHISSQVIDQCFSGGIVPDDAPVDKDVIVYGNNGNIVRARTVNQQRLVKLYDKNDLLFAVGPAGSGKTYTAIALAVRALKRAAGAAHHPHAPGRRGGREAGLPARRHEGEARSLPATFTTR